MKTKSIMAALFITIGAVVVMATPPDQPYMHAAKADLLTAKNELQLAARNKGGHRANAVSLVNQAIAQVNAGIAFDRRNNHARSSGAPDQPHMQRALEALLRAKGNLERASNDKGGHRVRALGYVNDAISQVNLGIAAGG